MSSAPIISTTQSSDNNKPIELGRRVVITKNGRRLVRVNRKRRPRVGRTRPKNEKNQPIATTVTTITSISNDPKDRVTTYRSKFRYNPKPTTSVTTSSSSVEAPIDTNEDNNSPSTVKPLTNRRAQTLQRIIRFRKKQRATDEDQ